MCEEIKIVSRKKRMAFFVFLVLILGMIAKTVRKESWSIEEITVSNTISAYMEADGVFEIPLDALVKQQRVRTYFYVSKGKANAALYDHAGKKIKSEPDFALPYDVYCIPADGDYYLCIEANDTDFTISVSVMDHAFVREIGFPQQAGPWIARGIACR